MIDNAREVLSLIEKHKCMTNEKLCEELNVSLSTLRRSLIVLEQEGHVRRIRGGVVLEVTQNQEISADYRSEILANEKSYIAELASFFIGGGMSIYLDSSGTVQKLLPFLKEISRLTVLNSGLRTACKLVESQLIEGKIFILGGEVHYDGASVLGLYGNSLINQLNVDLSFISPTGIDESGIYFANYNQMLLAEKMINQSKNTIVLVDHTKFGKTYAYQIDNLTAFEAVVTDRVPRRSFLEKIEALSVELLY